ncbi:MAG: hypothetical protein QM613_05190 [Micrococcaceae bacterium]
MSNDDIIAQRSKRIAELLPEKTHADVWQEIKQLHVQNMLDYVETHQNFDAALHEYSLWQDQLPIGLNLQNSPDDEDINGALFACGAYVQLGLYNPEHYGKAVNLASKMIKATKQQINVSSMFHMMRGDAYQWQRKYELAYEDYRQALNFNDILLEKYSEGVELTMLELSNAALHRRLFDNFILQNEYTQAELVIQDFEKRLVDNEQRNLAAHMYLDLAHDYHRSAHEHHEEEHLEPSFSLLNHALALFSENDDNGKCALIHQHIGSIMMCAGEHEKGKKYFRNALALHEIAKDEHWGPTTMCLAIAYQDEGDIGEFEKLMSLAEKRFADYSTHDMNAEFLHEKAAYYWFNGNLEKAKDYYNRSQDIYDMLIDPLEISSRPHAETCDYCDSSPELVEFFNEIQLERLDLNDFKI